jgi:hypothetical protein
VLIRLILVVILARYAQLCSFVNEKIVGSAFTAYIPPFLMSGIKIVNETGFIKKAIEILVGNREEPLILRE